MPTNTKPLVVIADDDPVVLKLLERYLFQWNYQTLAAPDKAALLKVLSTERPALVLLDLRFGAHDGVEVLREILQKWPKLIVVMLTAFGSIETAVSAIRHGAYEYLTKPPDFNRLMVTLQHAIEKQRLTERIEELQQQVESNGIGRPIWGESEGMRKVKELIATVAPTEATVLILGESGTGKELVARALHTHSLRKDGPFIAVNMAAMPRELIESTLFGHEKGSFTGADLAQKGCCEAADNGTLFLDEVSELELGLQAKLLRFLQERTIQRVGSSKTISVDVRIVAATNRNPLEEVKAGRIREDLYYRLNVVPLNIPPLRQRKEDIALLASMFLNRAAARYRRPVSHLSAEAVKVLTDYAWPGNVRQLEHMIERIVILNAPGEIGVNALPNEILEPESGGAPSEIRSLAPPRPEQPNDSLRAIDRMEREAITDALSKANGNVTEAARILGLGQATMYRKIKRYGLNPKSATQKPHEA